MRTAQTGSVAKIHYTMKLPSGEVVGTSRGGRPLDVKIGKGTVVEGLEKGLIGMQPNESRTIRVSPEEGFGSRNEKLVLTLAREEVQTDAELVPGRPIQFRSGVAETVNFVVIAVTEDTVTLDANHPLAGQTLTFDVVLVALSP
jgi:peptidylprolyl isomerase